MALALIYDRTMSSETRSRLGLPPPSRNGAGSTEQLFVQDLESPTIVSRTDTLQSASESRPHHHKLVIREFPTWIEPPKSAFDPNAGSGGSRRLSQTIFPPTTTQIVSPRARGGQGQPSPTQVIETYNSGFNSSNYQQLVNHLGSLHFDKSPSDTEIPNGRRSNIGSRHGGRSKVGFTNPGLILESDMESRSTTASASASSKRGRNRNQSASSRTSTETYRDTLYFQDGMRRIDMILAYEDDLDFLKETRRKTFLRNLVNDGLEIEMENPDPSKRFGQESRTHFVKIHAPWAVLTKYAEIMNMKMPIKKLISISYKAWEKSDGNDKKNWWSSWINMGVFDYNHERIPEEPSFFMASFTRQKEECFIIKDRETFFTTAQRSQIVWKIMTRVRFDDSSRDKMGIRRLLNDATYAAAYPLHEGPYDENDDSGEPNDRRLLYTEWAHFSNWYKRQPLWLVRRYFGDKVGLYFAWLGYYTGMLVPASVVGILCFLFGIATIDSDYNTPSKEICSHVAGQIIMCPLCGHCQLWPLDDSCTFSKLTYFFDNPATVFFAVFMAFWATSFLEFWKRKQAVISWEWDLKAFEVEEEPRPEFEAAVKTFRINPVTQAPEPYLSFLTKAVRMLVVSSIVFLLLFIVAFVVVGIIVYRLVMMSVIYTTDEDDYGFIKNNAKIITSVSAAIINLIIVVFLHNKVYYNLAMWLTNSEFPRTQTEYEDSFTFKMFLFQFINYYSYLIYIAFFKGRFFRHPGENPDFVFEKIRADMCDPAGCLSELFIQLSIIMVGKQFFNNFMELFMPKFSNWWRRLRYTNIVDSRSNSPVFLTRWEQDYNLKRVDQLALFQEYLEMVIQYGFVTLFVAAFPLAPFFALLNNIVEIRLDAYKWITQLRRPLAERVEDIGAWYGILQGITYTAVVTNAFVIAYTSDIIPRLVYKYTTNDTNLHGYINSSLSVYPTVEYELLSQREYNETKQPVCRYRGYYNPPGHPNAMEPSERYWHIMAARLAFVAVFEHLAFALTGVMAFAIPDVPREINIQIQREKLLASEALFENDLARLQRKKDSCVEENMGNEGQRGRRASSLTQDLMIGFSSKEPPDSGHNS